MDDILLGNTQERGRALYELAQSVASNVQNLLTMMKSQGLAPPSLGSDAPSPDFLPVGDSDLQELRRNIVNDSRLLADVFTGAQNHVHNMSCFPNHEAMTLRIMYNYDLPQNVPLQGTISYAALARKCGIDENRLTRVVRFLMTYHFFTEPELGHVAHSAASKVLATSKISRDYLGHCYEEMAPACFHQISSFNQAPHGETGSDCGLVEALGKPFFDVLNQDHTRGVRFNGAMQFSEFKASQEMVDGFDWQGAGDITMVDIGGSRGHTAQVILKHAPNLRKVIIQDLPSVVEDAKKQELPKDIQSRIAFEPACFFKPQPIRNADIYFMKRILHDWPDAKAVEILKNLVPSMKSGSRLIISDYVVSDLMSDAVHPYEARTARRADLQMMVALNAKERSLLEWKDLIGRGSKDSLEFESAGTSLIVFRKK